MFNLYNGKIWYPAFLTEVLHVPEISANLLSIGPVLNCGFKVKNRKDSIIVLNDTSKRIVTGNTQKGELFYIYIKIILKAHL